METMVDLASVCRLAHGSTSMADAERWYRDALSIHKVRLLEGAISFLNSFSAESLGLLFILIKYFTFLSF